MILSVLKLASQSAFGVGFLEQAVQEVTGISGNSADIYLRRKVWVQTTLRMKFILKAAGGRACSEAHTSSTSSSHLFATHEFGNEQGFKNHREKCKSLFRIR